MRCLAVLEYFMEPDWPNLSGDDTIKAKTGLARCLLLVDHVGNHRTLMHGGKPILVYGGKPIEWPQTKESE